jgi:Xaa-Pro aminopeptidase
MKRVVFITILCTGIQAIGQPIQLDMGVFAQRRAVFADQLVSQSIAIFPCKPEYTRNGDVEYQYRQESNFYYLTGFEEPESIVLLNPSGPRYKYVLFVRKRDPFRETWQGIRAGTEGAMTTFRADTALVFSDFRKSINALIPKAGTLYYAFGTNPQLDDMMRDIFLERPHGDNWSVMNPSSILSEMRLIKNDGDWEMGFTKAIDMSALAHVEAFKAIHPGMYECEVQAVFEYVYRGNGSPRNGYPCIVGSGPNSCTLHYDANTRRMNDGDVVLMDCAAEYGYYSGDITRTVPVNGKFSEEQRAIYQLVLDAQNAGIDMIKPGIPKGALDSAMNDILGTGLVKLGFIKNKKDSHIFTLHGFSHWLGLEVHDVGKYIVDGKSRVLAPGMVFTMEPGIYVRPDVPSKLKDLNYADDEVEKIRKRIEPYMNIGVRIEDDILVTENGFKNLSEAAPRDIDAIEALMKHQEAGIR